MNIETTRENDVCILSVSGAIDSSKSAVFEQRINELLQTGCERLLLDFQNLEYTSSAGLRVVLATAKKLKGPGRFALCALNENVFQVFELSGFSAILKLFPTRMEAIGAGLA